MNRKEKLTEGLKTNVTEFYRDAFELIAEMEGYDNASALLRHLVTSTVDEKVKYFSKFRDLVGDEKLSLGSESSQGSFTQFMRVMEQ
ncbi:hypothetical protein, partial [Pontibacterium sp.]|uniref:hypothetical protein n=1 Tax=Pontibacterium sp. TaxID=2036026 RepID=UPI003569121D